MAIAYRGGALLGDDATGLVSSISATIPASAQVDDVALLSVVQGTGANTFTDPAGWTLLAGPDRINANVSTSLWARKLIAGDPGSTVTVTASGGAHFVGVLEVFSGADTLAEIIDSTGTTATAATTVASPALTTVEANCLIVNFWAVRSATIPPPSVTAPAAHTAGGESNTAHAESPNFAVRASYRTAPTAGAWGGESATVSESATAITYSVALTTAAVPSSERIMRGGVWVPATITIF